MIHRFPFLWAHMFDRSDREGSGWAEALAENGQRYESHDLPSVEQWRAWNDELREESPILRHAVIEES